MERRNSVLSILLLLGFALAPRTVQASEVIEETSTQVVVREHPQTGKPYVSIIPAGAIPQDLFANPRKKFSRPDYRMLDPKIKSGVLPYDGPVSDRKKVYLLAASLATIGLAGGSVGLAAASAATTTPASGSAGAYYGAAGAVAVAGAAAAVDQGKPDLHKNDFDLKSESKLLKSNEK